MYKRVSVVFADWQKREKEDREIEKVSLRYSAREKVRELKTHVQ